MGREYEFGSAEETDEALWLLATGASAASHGGTCKCVRSAATSPWTIVVLVECSSAAAY